MFYFPHVTNRNLLGFSDGYFLESGVTVYGLTENIDTLITYVEPTLLILATAVERLIF